MSLRAIYEILIHIDRFRNIDLFNQGLYHLRCVLYYIKDGKVMSVVKE